MRHDTLSPPEAAAALGISRQRVHQLIQNGSLYAVQVYGRRWRIPRTEVERHARERRPANPASEG